MHPCGFYRVGFGIVPLEVQGSRIWLFEEEQSLFRALLRSVLLIQFSATAALLTNIGCILLSACNIRNKYERV